MMMMMIFGLQILLGQFGHLHLGCGGGCGGCGGGIAIAPVVLACVETDVGAGVDD